MRPLTIAYISEAAPQDRHAWSGTVHYTYESLCDAGFNVITLGPERPRFWRFLLAGLNKLSLSVFKKRLDYRHSIRYSKEFGRIFTAKLKSIQYDVVLVCGSTECGAYIKTSKPIYYVLDRTIAGALNYHQILKDLWDFSREQSVITDRKAMTEARKLIFSSNWAATHAKQHYGISDASIAVFPFGANLDSVPPRDLVLAPKSQSQWNLLLIGSDWINKGADIAYNTFILLKAKNLPVKLTIVGCTPPEQIHDKDVTVIPFIDKNTKEGMQQITELFLAHHFFILPTRFDCTPIVFCEASAFGVPVLSADTGGVRGHITECVNGFLIPYEDKGELYAKTIIELTQDPLKYKQLRESTRNLYESSLNWNAWGTQFRKLAEADLTQ